MRFGWFRGKFVSMRNALVIAPTLSALLVGPVLAQAPAAPPPVAAAPPPAVKAGMSLEEQFTLFLHFIALGRYDFAQAYGADLLQRPDLDPAKILEYADEQKKSVETLITMSSHATLGPAVRGVLEVIEQGRHLRRTDPARIRAQIERLAGNPRAVLLATENLRESGEYALPWIVEYLRDSERASLHPRIVNALPQIGLGAMNPAVIALSMADDDATRRFLIDSLGKLAYRQAVPYLKKIVETDGVEAEIRAAALRAIRQITRDRGDGSSRSAADLFVDLAEQYYREGGRSALRPDLRAADTNVWYWRDRFLKNIPVPTAIFNEIMCMRCCEEALLLESDRADAISLWLAANFRREAQLGMNVEADQAEPAGTADRTKPADYPRSIVFARSAGPRYNHMALARANRDVDPAVALGAVGALSVTAGATSLLDSSGAPQPLARALAFPDLVVRIKAALALGRALPTTRFLEYEQVIPVLAEALAQTGDRHAIVVDPKEQGRNDTQGKLRDQGFRVVAEANLPAALDRAREEVPFVDAIFISSDVVDPDLTTALANLRKDFMFAATPVIILFEPQHGTLAENLALADVRVSRMLPASSAERLVSEWRSVAATVGRLELDKARALELALATANTLRQIAVSRSTVYNFNRAQPALIAALAHPEESLRIRAASVLALAKSDEAQQAIGAVAMNPANTVTLRSAAFGSLAESAKNNGRKLTPEQIAQLIGQAVGEADPVVRAAASKALGALNIKPNQASKIIRDQHAG